MAGHDDHSFGPWYDEKFDFTLRFEHIIFTILPASIMIAVFQSLLHRYARKPVVVGRGWVLYAKLASAVGLLGVELGNLVLWSQQSFQYYSVFAIVGSSLSFAASCCMVSFLDVEHRHSLRSSSLLSIYLLFSLILDIIKARTCSSRDRDLGIIGSLLIAAAVLKGAIVLLGETPKTAYILDEQQQSLGMEPTNGFGSRSLFSWLMKSILYGYHNVLDIEDLDVLEMELSATYLSNKFAIVWSRTKKTASSYCLMKALLRCLCGPLCAIIVPRLCHTGFMFAQPFLLQRVLIYIEQESSASYSRSLIGATVLTYLGIAISRAIYSHLSHRLVTLARGVLVSHILEKTLRIEYSQANEKSVMRLMRDDIEALIIGLPTLHENLINFVEVGIGMHLLTLVVGRASFLVLLPLILSIFASLFLGKGIATTRKAWNDSIQHRVSQTASALKNVIGIKILALEGPVLAYIQGLRVTELEHSKPFRLYSLCMPTAGTFSYCVAPVIVMGGAIFWANPSETLTAVQAFQTMAIISLISRPLMKILSSYSNFTSALACVRRIQNFLLLEEREDCRTELESTEFLDEESEIMSSVSSQTSRMTPLLDERSEIMSSISSQTSRMTPLLEENEIIFSGHLVSIESPSGGFFIHNASFCIQRSTFTVVTGSVASSKSMLLRALLGEVRFDGTIEVLSMSGGIAYCDAIPWIRSMSIRENIIGEHTFNMAWYETVLNACLLVEDLQWLPDGDETIIGNDGYNLSEGQKQKIALARALYSQEPAMFFEEVLINLDPHTASAIALNLFGRNGLLRALQTTVVMASQSARLASLADNILYINGAGSVERRPIPQSILPTTDTALAARHYNSELSNIASTDTAKHEDKVSAEENTQKIASMEAQEDSTLRRKGDIALYKFYFRSTKTWMVFVWLFALTIASVLQELPPIYVRIWLDLDASNNLYFIGYAIIGCLPCVACAGMFWFFYYYVLPDSCNSLHEMLLKTVMRATSAFLTETDNAVILNRFNQDMNRISQELPRAILIVIYSSLCFMVAMSVFISVSQYIIAIMPLILTVIYLIQHFYIRTSRQMRFLDLETKTPLYTYVSEMATGLHHIRAFGLSSTTLQDGLDLFDISQRPFHYTFFIKRWLTLSTDMTALGIATALVSFGVLFPHTTSQAAIGLSLCYVMVLGEDLSARIQMWANLDTFLGVISRIRSFLKYTPQEPRIDGPIVPSPRWPQSGHIIISNMTAAYNSMDVPQCILHNISIEIHAGQKAVIVGRTGSGKSSLLLALLNFLDCSGPILIDGVDVTKTPQQILRSRITTITQDPVELEGTLRYNLMPFQLGPDENQTFFDEDAIDVLRQVRLWEYVTLHGGLDAPLSGLGFSSGQKQLMSIARAVLHNRLKATNIVLMDEPTSNLDPDTDIRVQREVFNTAFSHSTMLCVAHRLETLRRTDWSLIIEMAEGRVIRVTRP